MKTKIGEVFLPTPIDSDSTLSITLWPWRRNTWYVQCVDGLHERETYNKSFAQAVHDALVEALGIGEATDDT